MAFDFPNSPTTGQTVTGPGGIVWQWDGVKWTILNVGSPGFAPVNNPIFSGDPQAPTAAYGDNDQSLSNTAFVQNAVTPLTHNIGRNLIHNALFNVQQRGAGPWTASSIYTADRYLVAYLNDTVSISLVALGDTDRTAIGDEAATNAYQVTFTGASASGSYTLFVHRCEGVRRFGNKQVTLSFWAHATSGTPRVGLGYGQMFGNGGSPSTTVYGNLGITPALSATWQRYSITATIPSTAGKTLGTSSPPADLLQLEWWLSDQGTYTNRSGGPGVQSGTVQFWGMQLEIGPTATPLAKLDYALDLINCQRFYEFSNMIYYGLQANAADSYRNWSFRYLVQKRAAATITFSGASPAPTLGTNTVDGWYANYNYGNTSSAYAITNWTASADL